MKKTLIFLILFFFIKISSGQNTPPVISNLTASTDIPNNTITLDFDLADAENNELELTLLVSTNEGFTYQETTSVTGDIGFPITPSTSKSINWTPPNINDSYKLKLVATDLQPIDIASVISQVDTTLLWDDLTALEGIRHRETGSELLEATKTRLENHFLEHGLQLENQEWEIPNYSAKNVIGKLEGHSSDPEIFIIDGHYDSVEDSPGADDNATAVAGVMAAARILSNYGFKRTIKFIGFDLEEAGLGGSGHYVSNSIAAGEIIGGTINLEMIGYYDDNPFSQSFPLPFQDAYPEALALLQADDFRGNFIINAGYINFPELRDTFYNIANTYVPDLKVINLTATSFNGITNQALIRSDHAPFWLFGKPAIMLTDGAEFRNPNYHTVNDTKETLNMEFMGNVVKAAIATIADLAGIQSSSAATVDILSNIKELDCDFQIFPNPVASNLKLHFGDCNLSNFKIQILSPLGVSVFEKNINGFEQSSETIYLQNLKSGFYFLNIEQDGKSWSGKIVIE